MKRRKRNALDRGRMLSVSAIIQFSYERFHCWRLRHLRGEIIRERHKCLESIPFLTHRTRTGRWFFAPTRIFECLAHRLAQRNGGGRGARSCSQQNYCFMHVSPCEEALASAYDISDARICESGLKSGGLRVRAKQDRNFAGFDSLLEQITYAFDNSACLGHVIVIGGEFRLRPAGALGLERETRAVGGAAPLNNVVCNPDYLGRRTIIAR